MAHAQPLFDLRSLAEIERDRAIRRAEDAASRGDLAGVSRFVSQAARHAPLPGTKTHDLLRACFDAQEELRKASHSR